MQNFSISLNTCLLRSLGWIWSVWCLERTSCGYWLQPNNIHLKPLGIKQYTEQGFWCDKWKHNFIENTPVHLSRVWMLKSGAHQESSSVTSRCWRFGWPRTYSSAKGSLSRRIRGTHIYQDERRTGKLRLTVFFKELRFFINHSVRADLTFSMSRSFWRSTLTLNTTACYKTNTLCTCTCTGIVEYWQFDHLI